MSDMKNLGFVMMLDVSGSMRSSLPMVKIDSKAFVRCAHVGDQFGVNAFSDNAWWVHPSGNNPDILTVKDGLKETEDAVQKIEKLTTHNMTHMGEAIQLANKMIAKASTPLKAFVLLSDGAHNAGIDPVSVLGAEPPIYIAGLAILDQHYFDALLKKNKKSKFYNSPIAYEMMLMYNHILSESTDSNLAMNHLKDYRAGSDYYLETFNITEDDNDVQLSVVWSDKKYKYTPNTPSGTNINIVLIDPNDNITNIKPDIAEEGYCIYNLKNARPGEWKFLIQYSVTENLGGTAAAFEFHTSVKTNLILPSYAQSKDDIRLTVEALRDNHQLENVTVKAHISQPDYAVDDVLNRFENEIGAVDVDEETEDNEFNRLKVLRTQKLKNDNIDILPVKHSVKTISLDSNEGYSMTLNDTEKKGTYNVDIEITGIDPVTKRPFKSLQAGSVLVG